MGLLLNETLADEGVTASILVKAGDAIRYTVDLSNDFDGVLFLRFTADGQSYQLTEISADVTNVDLEVSKDGRYDFNCQYGAGETSLTGTATVSINAMDKVLFEVKDFTGAPKFQVTEGGLVVNGPQVSEGVGATNGSAVSVVEKGNGVIHQSVIRLSSLAVTVANTTGASFGGVKLYDMPEGRILVLGVTADLSVNWAGTSIVATGSGDFSLGTTITADATLSGTDVNLLPSTAMTDPFVAGVGAAKGALAASAQFDGTATAIDVNLNMIIDDADVENAASDSVLVSGTVTLTWINLGDY